MEFQYAYKGHSAVASQADQTQMAFAPDVKREPTYFSGILRQHVAFREAISALHSVVVSDLRFQPKDKSAYKAWAAQQELIDWHTVATQRQEVAGRIQALQDELRDLYQRRSARWLEFYQRRSEYFTYLYRKDFNVWILLDPVITVHPDEVFFECFSQDESSYGRLGASYEVFDDIGALACGTTNIDYSAALYDEFQKIRSYKTTQLSVDPSGFDVATTGEDAYTEVKIDLPDSWVRGFLQVSSAMALPATSFTLHPMDLHNLCLVLRRHKETHGPRSMRYHLVPEAPVQVVFEPWDITVTCPRSLYHGPEAQTIRVWGRRRLHILERLIPVARAFTVHLLGTGLPSFYIADLGDLSFTLGLSGWTANDWAQAGNFDLLAPRADVDDVTKRRVFDTLKQSWVATPDAVAQQLQLDRRVVLGALGAYTQAGRAMYDLNKGVYRVRELSREPLPMEQLRFANPRDEQATTLVVQQAVQITTAQRDAAGNLLLTGQVRDKEQRLTPMLTIDQDERLVRAECTCNWHQQHKLFRGPCAHILAVRMQQARQSCLAP